MPQIEQFKDDRHLPQLAVFNGDRLAISLYNKQLAVVETQMSKLDLFLKKTNTTLIDPLSVNPNIPIAVNMRLYQGILVTFNLNQICVIDYNLMTYKHSISTNIHLSSMFTLNSSSHSLAMLASE